MPKPLPHNDLFDEELKVGLRGHFVAFERELRTLCTFLGSAVVATLRTLTATRRPLRVAS